MIWALVILALIVLLAILNDVLFPQPAVRFTFFNSSHKEICMLKLSTIQKSTIGIKPVDKKGNPAPVDGVPVWDVSAPGSVSLFPSADGMSCDVLGIAPGSVQVNVSADADMGEGTKTITGTLDVEVTAAEAAGFAIQTGPVEDQ